MCRGQEARLVFGDVEAEVFGLLGTSDHGGQCAQSGIVKKTLASAYLTVSKY